MALLEVLKDIDENINIHCHTCDPLEDCRIFLPKNDNYNFKVLTLNIRSYQRNFDDFCIAFKRLDTDFDVVVLTECWLSEGTILEPLPGYSVSRSQLQSNKNGGVIIYTLMNRNVKVIESVIAEADSLLLELDNSIAILGIYRSPSFSNLDNFIVSLDTVLSQIKKYSTVVVTGDINIDIISTSISNHTEYLCLMASHGLLPAITEPTRGNTCLDHIFIKSSCRTVGIIGKCSITDHDMVLAATSLINSSKSPTRSRWINKTDHDAIAEELLNTDWSDILNSNCVNSATNTLISIISNQISKHTHKVKISRSKFTIKPWMTPGLMRCVRHRDKLHQSANANPNDKMKGLVYTRYRNFCNKLLHNLRTEYNSGRINENRKDPKKLWNTLKSIYNPNKQIGDSAQLIFNAKDPHHSLNSCNSYFTSLGKKLSDLILSRISESQASLATKYKARENCPHSFFLHPTDETEITKFIYALKTESAPGLDGVTTRLILKIKNAILTPLTHIFNLSLESGTFPECWKVASIRPIHKNGPTELPENYRPIALLSILSKILEKIVNNRIVNFFEKHKLISDRQFGFQRGRSTEDAATLLTNSVATFTENGEKALGVFLDLAKAFDTISIDLLLKKLECAGIRGISLKWFTSYLSNRKQLVKIGDHSSDLLPINFGIPQGSTLGPTLFSFYMNDILNIPLNDAEIISYADDTAIIFHAKTWDQVYRLAENGLITVSEALDANLLTLNIKKTKFITFFKTLASKPPSQLILKYHTCCSDQSLPLANCTCTVLDHTSSIKYLGITLDENLSFKPHIHLLTGRVRKLIFVMKKLRDCTPIEILRTIYLGLCQSVLQYGIAVWGAAGKSTFISLERAQRAVIKVTLKKPFRYPTDLIHKELGVLRVRQLYILSASLCVHKTLKNRPDYKQIISKRVLHIPLPLANSLLARRAPFYSHIYIYNKICKSCDIKDLKNFACKKTIMEWLAQISYKETEDILT